MLVYLIGKFTRVVDTDMNPGDGCIVGHSGQAIRCHFGQQGAGQDVFNIPGAGIDFLTPRDDMNQHVVVAEVRLVVFANGPQAVASAGVDTLLVGRGEDVADPAPISCGGVRRPGRVAPGSPSRCFRNARKRSSCSNSPEASPTRAPASSISWVW